MPNGCGKIGTRIREFLQPSLPPIRALRAQAMVGSQLRPVTDRHRGYGTQALVFLFTQLIVSERA